MVVLVLVAHSFTTFMYTHMLSTKVRGIYLFSLLYHT